MLDLVTIMFWIQNFKFKFQQVFFATLQAIHNSMENELAPIMNSSNKAPMGKMCLRRIGSMFVKIFINLISIWNSKTRGIQGTLLKLIKL